MPVSQIWISLFGVSKVPITSTVWCVNNGIVILQIFFWNCHFGLNIISKVCTVNQLVMFSLALNLQINWLWWIQSYCENSVCYGSIQEKFVLLQCQGSSVSSWFTLGNPGVRTHDMIVFYCFAQRFINPTDSIKYVYIYYFREVLSL